MFLNIVIATTGKKLHRMQQPCRQYLLEPKPVSRPNSWNFFNHDTHTAGIFWRARLKTPGGRKRMFEFLVDLRSHQKAHLDKSNNNKSYGTKRQRWQVLPEDIKDTSG
eukprot:4908727-Amphidinium_carterae.1